MGKEPDKREPVQSRRKTETIFQMEATECGAASLAMILNYYGRYTSLDEVRIAVGVSRDGAKAGNIMRAAERYGLENHGYRRELEDLVRMEPPCIIHWNFNHFVVYEGAKNGKYYLNDPAYGHRALTYEELDDGYTGIVITFKPTERLAKIKKKNTFLSSAMQLLKGQESGLAALMLTGLLLVLPGFMTAAVSQVFIDRILIGGAVRWLPALLMVIVLNMLYQVFFLSLRNSILLKQQNKLALLSTQRFLHHLFRLPVSFFSQRMAGDLAGRIDNNDKVSNLVGGGLPEIAVSCFESVFYLVILVFYSPLLTLIAVAGFAADIALVIYSSKRMEEISMKFNQDSGGLNGTLVQGISILDSLKASGTENDFVGRLLGRYAKVSVSEQKMKRTQQILNAFPQAVMSALNILLLMVGSLLVIRGNMTVGALVAFTSLFSLLLKPANTLTGFVYNIQTTKTDLMRVNDILTYKEEKKYSRENHESEEGRLEGKVTLKNVSFGYSSLGPPVISDFSMEVQPGKSVAIIGASGCGKSTVTKLICGLYEPWQGEIRIDDRLISEIPLDVMHLSVSNVSQDITTFSASVRDNITLWNEAIPDGDVIRAAEDAGIHDFVTERPGGYNYVLTEGGKDFSGGQRQKMEIARSLVLNPSVIILDEATSALDTLQEEQVMKNIRSRGCTLIVIAHRLSAVRDCDEIIVLNQGRIQERGTHDSLMADPDSLYRKLIQLD